MNAPPDVKTAVQRIATLVKDLESSAQAEFYQEVAKMLTALAHHQEEAAHWSELLNGAEGTDGSTASAGRGEESPASELLSRYLRGHSGKRPSVAKASMAVIAVHGPMNTRDISDALEAEGYSVSGGKNQIRSSLFGPRKKGRVKFVRGKYKFPTPDAVNTFRQEAGLT